MPLFDLKPYEDFLNLNNFSEKTKEELTGEIRNPEHQLF